MTKQEILAYLKEQVQDNKRDPEYDLKNEPAGVKFTVEDQVGGEDQGSEYYVVLKVTTLDKPPFFVMCTGYYSSYEGTDWSYGEVFECEEYQKTVRDWRAVK